MPPFRLFKGDSGTYCKYCQTRMHDSEGCIVHLLNTCKQIGQKVAQRCSFNPNWREVFDNRCLETRPHAGPLLAQVEPSFLQAYREQFTDTMLCSQKTERLNVHYLGAYSARSCSFSTWRLTNQPLHRMHVVHRITGLVEPQGNTMSQGSSRYTNIAMSPAFCPGYYWQYSNDDNQLLNATEVMRAVASTRCQWYRAIESAENGVDKTTREYQEELHGQHVIDGWSRRDIEFVTDNVLLWSRCFVRHDNSAESFVSLPAQRPSSIAYARRNLQRLARHCG